jgi:ferrous iron transport protein B
MTATTSLFTIGLAGQPNVGKSTIFNMLTGARQHIANFPGVTVEKKEGKFSWEGRRFSVTDLPGTYSLTSYSIEERVSRDFILNESPDLVVVTVDASNLERNLYLVFQVIELGRPTAVILNMTDVAESRGVRIDRPALERRLGVPVIATVGHKGKGIDAVKQTVSSLAAGGADYGEAVRIDYGESLEPLLDELAQEIAALYQDRSSLPPRWAAIKLLENDEGVRRRILESGLDGAGRFIEQTDARIADFTEKHSKTPNKTIAVQRYQKAGEIVAACVQREKTSSRTLTDRIDAIVLHRVIGPLILVAVMFVFYQIVMNLGTRLADLVFPYLNRVREPVENLFGPSADLLRDGLLQSLVNDGAITGIMSIFYYVPIFLVLFALIAALEDTGYLSRVAFIMDRVLRGFGLHGQSTLPLILGGVIVGGCAVPGVMATRAIKDEKARLITILIMPLMNCLAKIPFYILIVGMFFAAYQGAILFGISVFTFLTAMVVAKVFSRCLVKGVEAPFVMELSAYHLPTLQGIVRRTFERTWLFIRKVFTIILAVMVVVWFFLLFPGIGFEREAEYDRLLAARIQTMAEKVGTDNRYHTYLEGPSLANLLDYTDQYRRGSRRVIGDPEAIERLNQRFNRLNPDFFPLVNGGRNIDGVMDVEARLTSSVLKKFQRELTFLKRERKKELIDQSYAAALGRLLEPVTQLAGFNWKINVAVISTFAAKESLVGTLGMIYATEGDESLSKTMQQAESGWTVWHALAILVLVALFPPCLATLVMIKVETQRYRWAAFAAVYPIVIGFILAMLVFQVGMLLSG